MVTSTVVNDDRKRPPLTLIHEGGEWIVTGPSSLGLTHEEGGGAVSLGKESFHLQLAVACEEDGDVAVAITRDPPPTRSGQRGR